MSLNCTPHNYRNSILSFSIIIAACAYYTKRGEMCNFLVALNTVFVWDMRHFTFDLWHLFSKRNYFKIVSFIVQNWHPLKSLHMLVGIRSSLWDWSWCIHWLWLLVMGNGQPRVESTWWHDILRVCLVKRRVFSLESETWTVLLVPSLMDFAW